MTSKEFMEMFNSRWVGYNDVIRDCVNGIYQCLVNQEKIMEMLKNKQYGDTDCTL